MGVNDTTLERERERELLVIVHEMFFACVEKRTVSDQYLTLQRFPAALTTAHRCGSWPTVHWQTWTLELPTCT